MKVLKAFVNDQKTSAWSGGTTTELAIYPQGSDYQKRDFDFRISTAKIDVEHSVFTSLPGVRRILMLLEGELLLKHQHHYEKQLIPFQWDAFNGEWKTESVGKAIDLNLMMRGDVQGDLRHHKLNQSTYQITIESENIILGIYLFTGKIIVNVPDQNIEMNHGDFVLLTECFQGQQINITSADSADVVIATLKYPH